VPSCRVPVLGVFVVGVTNRSGEGVGPKFLRRMFDTQGEGHKGNGNIGYNAWSLGCLVVRRCPSGRIEAEPRCLVVGAAAWPGEAVHPGTLGASSE
jgi:hypothetical protein